MSHRSGIVVKPELDKAISETRSGKYRLLQVKFLNPVLVCGILDLQTKKAYNFLYFPQNWMPFLFGDRVNLKKWIFFPEFTDRG